MKRKKTVRPNDLVIGMIVLSQTLGQNMPPTLFTVKELGNPVTLNDGSKLVSVLVENGAGQGGWEDCWEREWAIGPLFFAS
jgi:hypothetical protein